MWRRVKTASLQSHFCLPLPYRLIRLSQEVTTHRSPKTKPIHVWRISSSPISHVPSVKHVDTSIPPSSYFRHLLSFSLFVSPFLLLPPSIASFHRRFNIVLITPIQHWNSLLFRIQPTGDLLDHRITSNFRLVSFPFSVTLLNLQFEIHMCFVQHNLFQVHVNYMVQLWGMGLSNSDWCNPMKFWILW